MVIKKAGLNKTTVECSSINSDMVVLDFKSCIGKTIISRFTLELNSSQLDKFKRLTDREFNTHPTVFHTNGMAYIKFTHSGSRSISNRKTEEDTTVQIIRTYSDCILLVTAENTITGINIPYSICLNRSDSKVEKLNAFITNLQGKMFALRTNKTREP